ncbi:dihydroorotase [Methylobrevis albus]|uniref:Dihydroorotase n=1 Tax=Methylobrevis albus TaxID=2793297 RepID=A0A931MYF8_9HYPH|nr:dihydroorotase [Methylobrevis albus]MBH0237009.1 dihydroorotase [Methylobrevis albus]
MPTDNPSGLRPLKIDNARLVDPSRGLDTRGAVLVVDGRIVAAGPEAVAIAGPEGTERIDAGGAVIAPGLVDMRVFVGEPGFDYRETFASASRAAAAGGITTIVTMPDTDPVIDEPALVDFVLRRARDTATVRVHPMAALTKGQQGREMTEFGLLQEAGAVAFASGRTAVSHAQVMRRALTYARDFGALVIHHAEDPDLAGDGVMNAGAVATLLGLKGVPAEAETIMLARDLRLARLAGGRYHAALLSAAESVELMRWAKSLGIPATAGVSVAHLSLNENDIGAYRTFFKMSPPLRAETDRLALVEGLADGTIDVVVSGHDPQDVETKRQPFAEAADGCIGLETLLSAGLRLVHDGRVSLSRLIDAMSTRPAALLGLPSGTLQPGAAADLVLIDLDTPWVYDEATILSRCHNTAFEGARFSGRAVKTWVGGRLVFGG